MNWSEIFRYDDHTGKLHWKTATNRRIKIGCEAGTLLDNGYLGVGVNKKRYLAHRIIWDMNNPDDALQHGEEIDHIDHDKLNNRLHNLRKVTKITNHRNRPKNKNNTSGTTGVSYHKNHGRWYAQIMVHGRTVYLGHFKDKNAAIEARKIADIKFGFHKNHGK